MTGPDRHVSKHNMYSQLAASFTYTVALPPHTCTAPLPSPPLHACHAARLSLPAPHPFPLLLPPPLSLTHTPFYHSKITFPTTYFFSHTTYHSLSLPLPTLYHTPPHAHERRHLPACHGNWRQADRRVSESNYYEAGQANVACHTCRKHVLRAALQANTIRTFPNQRKPGQCKKAEEKAGMKVKRW